MSTGGGGGRLGQDPQGHMASIVALLSKRTWRSIIAKQVAEGPCHQGLEAWPKDLHA